MAKSPQLFELHLTPIGNDGVRFKTIVTDSVLGSDAESESDLPFWVAQKDWRTTVIKILESPKGFRASSFTQTGEQDWMVEAGILSSKHPSFTPDYLERIGQQLFRALLPPDNQVGQAFQSALRMAEKGGEILHLRLKFSAESAKRSRVADYPWELIHDGHRFMLHRRVRISRYIAYDAIPPRQSTGNRLRVLLVSPRASDITALSDAEPNAILTGIANAESTSLEQLPESTWRALSTYLTEAKTPPQVLHFDGHGIFGKRCQICGHLHDSTKVEICQKCGAPLPEAQGYLAFEDEQKRADFISAKSLAGLLADKGITLAVLSACQSGMAVVGESVFNGTAQQLIDAQIPAVVAMQYLVLASAAANFTEQFYRILGQKGTLLDAIGQGRTWMGFDSNQWYRPVLYLRWRDNDGGSLFEQESLVTETSLKLDSKPSISQTHLQTTSTTIKTGRKLALLIGVSQYEQSLTPLPGAIRDIEALQEVLQSDTLGDFDEVQLLTNPDSQYMRESIETLFAKCDHEDLILLFFSGHGIKDNNNRLYFGTSNTGKSESGELIKSSAVSASFIHDVMEGSRSQQQVVILDCCFSGAFPKGLVPKNDSTVDITQQLGGAGRAILTSSTAMQNSFSPEGEELSFYTRYLVEGIRTGKADLDGDRLISTKDISRYIEEQARKLLPIIKPSLHAESDGECIYVSKTPLQHEVTHAVESLLQKSTGTSPKNRLSLSPTAVVVAKTFAITLFFFAFLSGGTIFWRTRQNCLTLKRDLSPGISGEELASDPEKLERLQIAKQKLYSSRYNYLPISRRCSMVGVNVK